MLIALEQIFRRGADSQPVVKTIGLNPESIERVESTYEIGEGSCVMLFVNGDQLVTVRGSVLDIVKATREATWGPPQQEATSGM
jgi:hypothetical protein